MNPVEPQDDERRPGWGTVSGLIGGLLIGLAVAALVTRLPAVLGFVAAMTAGMALHAWLSGEDTVPNPR